LLQEEFETYKLHIRILKFKMCKILIKLAFDSKILKSKDIFRKTKGAREVGGISLQKGLQ